MHIYAFDEYALYAYTGYMKLNMYLTTKGITDEAFGRKIGCSQSQVSRIKRGVSKPSLGLIERIALATGGAVRANDFMTTVAPPKRPRSVRASV